MNLDFMRDNRPNPSEPQVTVNDVPIVSYDDPEPGAGGLGGYFVQETLSKNSVGRAGAKTGEAADPTSEGQTSINLGSQNVNFVAPIVSLSGRGGLGVNLALSYNSNVWVKNGSAIAFNTDKSVAGVGWSIGFGAIQGVPSGASIEPFWDSTISKYIFIYIEPDGTRRALAQVGLTNIYVSHDSSYIEFNNSTKVLRLMNGTQISFITPTYGGAAVGKRLLPSQIKDRNGNYITIANAEISNGNGVANNSHDWGIDYIVDTLGRTIDFYYESNLLRKVLQDRGGGTWFDYVVISYAPITISTNFSGLTTDPSNINGQQVWQPWYIEYPTKHNTRFFYTSYGQMYQVEKWVPTVSDQGNGRIVAFTRYDMQSVSGYSAPGGAMAAPGGNAAQTDCPKFSLRQEWAENWSPSSATSGWTAITASWGTAYVAQYSYEFNIANNFSKVIDPKDRVFRTDVSTDGLTHTSKVYASQAAYNGGSGTPLKTTTITFEKDSGLSYTSNLRVTNLQINDGGATRRTGYTYTITGGVALPTDVIEYNSDATTVYRHTVTTYNPNTNYSNRHILGLPAGIQTYSGAGTGNLIRSTAFTYDEGTYFDTTGYTATNHDAANYGTGFSWRANLTTVTQFETPGAGSHAISRTKYDMLGNVRAVYDGANNVTQFFYDDNFVTSPGGSQRRAFVTKVQSSAYSINGGASGSSWSGAKYNYYTGSVAQNYHIAGTSGTGSHENIVNYAYYNDGRLYYIAQPTGGQVTRDYWDNWMAVATYTKIDATRTRYDFLAYDGAGQTRWQGGDHPDGVSGKYRIQTFAYDSVGRTVSTSNPTAADGGLSANYPAWEEDYYFGWLYTTTAYDALDRPTLITRPDSHTAQFSYTGCGCAGSSTVTTTDERGKKRKVVYDFLGRLSEAHNLTSAGATYSRAVYSYDARDLLLNIKHYNSGSAFQERTFAYDGYGRLQSQATPEAGTVNYTYYANDLVHTAQNQRIVQGTGQFYKVTFAYNGLGLLTEVKYNDVDYAPTNYVQTPDVYYEYGEYGERTWMREKNDAGVTLGSTQYIYDDFKRLETETRKFNGLPSGNTYRVGYEYNYVDAPTQLTYNINGWTKNVNYAYKTSGALSSVGTDMVSLVGYNTTNNVANSFDYRAFSALQSVNYGNGRKLNAGYNQLRSQLTNLQVKKTDNTDPIINISYDYYSGGGGSGGNNGRIRAITDSLDGMFSAALSYDDHNRLTSYGPNYQRSYTYDEWNNLRTVTSGTGGGEAPNYTLSYANNASGAPETNRIANAGYDYDQAGNMINDGSQSFTYDAASRLKTASGSASSYEYDGDGRRVKQANSAGTIHYLWSSVLGEPVAELTSGGVYRAYVYGPGGGQMIAMQSYDAQFYWLHTDHLGNGRKITNSSGTVVYRGEFDPHGQALYEWHSTGQTYLNSHKYTGYERDWATNLNYAKARTYNHNRGRFMQPDPLGLEAADAANPQSLNLYSYVQNDPVSFVDPTGTDLIAVTTCVTQKLGGEIIGIDCETTYYFTGGGPVALPFGGIGGDGGQENPQLPTGELPPQEEVIDPCVSRLSRILTDINLARTGLNQFIESKSASANGLGYVVRFKDPRAARNYLEANFDRLPGIFGGLGTAYHRKELRSAFPAATEGFTDFRGKNDPSSGTRSLQVVTYGPGAFVDTDRYNPYQGPGGFFGHLFKEVIGRRGTVDIEKLCK